MRLTLTLTKEATGGAEPPRTFAFEQPVVRFGRAEDNDLTVDDPSLVVSKRHGLLRVEEAGLVIEDLGSKNCTFVNEQRLTAGVPHPLRPGDIVSFGPFWLEAQLHAVPAAPAFDREQTPFAPRFANPFAEEVRALAEALGRLRRSVLTSDHARREEAAAEALREAFGPGGTAEAVLALLRGEPASTPPTVPPFAADERGGAAPPMPGFSEPPASSTSAASTPSPR